ncbi:hypothetical protein [Pyrococcus horikoshii]|nr:hypothetical protein [Pyrococcus horikoshii]HII60990.1 hypothetical protein [Pyrococcus horikoshii]
MREFYFYGYPTQLSISTYEEVLSEYVDLISQDDNVLAVYQSGSISVPGISDLDIFIVLDDPFNKNTIEVLRNWRRDMTSRYIFYHSPFIISKEDFPSIKYVHTAFNLRRIYGSEIPIINPSNDEITFIKILNILDWSYILTVSLSEMFLRRKIHMRTALMTLGSVAHTLALAQDILGCKDYRKIIRSIRAFRRNFFKLPDHGYKYRMPDLIIKSFEALIDIVKHVTEYMLSMEYIYYDVHKNIKLQVRPDLIINFKSYKSTYDIYNGKLIKVLAIPIIAIELPNTFLIINSEYSKYCSQGILKVYRINSYYNLHLDNDFKHVIQKRMTLFNKIIKYIPEDFTQYIPINFYSKQDLCSNSYFIRTIFRTVINELKYLANQFRFKR